MKTTKTNRVETLDKVNDKRVEETKKRLAHALLLLNDTDICAENNNLQSAIKLAAQAMSLLTTAADEMTFACEHYDWDLDVVDIINESIGKIA